jgi:hypothetical protein
VSCGATCVGGAGVTERDGRAVGLRCAEVLDGLRQQQSLPVFTLFYESSCAHSIKALRTFEQAAGFFRDFIKFAKVLRVALRCV